MCLHRTFSCPPYGLGCPCNSGVGQWFVPITTIGYDPKTGRPIIQPAIKLPGNDIKKAAPST